LGENLFFLLVFLAKMEEQNELFVLIKKYERSKFAPDYQLILKGEEQSSFDILCFLKRFTNNTHIIPLN